MYPHTNNALPWSLSLVSSPSSTVKCFQTFVYIIPQLEPLLVCMPCVQAQRYHFTPNNNRRSIFAMLHKPHLPGCSTPKLPINCVSRVGSCLPIIYMFLPTVVYYCYYYAPTAWSKVSAHEIYLWELSPDFIHNTTTTYLTSRRVSVEGWCSCVMYH